MATHFGDEADAEAPKLLLLLSRGECFHRHSSTTAVASSKARVFECKTCNKTFPTFQALGGHRTGHKRPRDEENATAAAAPKKAAHQCPVCGLVFSLGQALGGHMRRHRDIVNANKKEETAGTDATIKCTKEDTAADSGTSFELLSGCSSSISDSRGEEATDDVKAATIVPLRLLGGSLDGGACPVDLELRLGRLDAAPAPAVLRRAYDEASLTTLRLGIEA